MASRYGNNIHHWSFVRRIHRKPVDSPYKGPNDVELWYLLWCGPDVKLTVSRRWFQTPWRSCDVIVMMRWAGICFHVSWTSPYRSVYTRYMYMTFYHMMTSSNGNIFRVTGHLCGEFTGHRWFPRTKASDAELWCFLWSTPGIKGWVNNRQAGDLRRNRAHYDAIVCNEWPRSFHLELSCCWLEATSTVM